MTRSRVGRCSSCAQRVRGRRHGSNPGTVRLAGQRVPLRVPRVRSVAGGEIPLRSYEAAREDSQVNDVLLKRVLYGISCRNYAAAAESVPGAIGLSSSTVSRNFIQASAATLREFQERDLRSTNPIENLTGGVAKFTRNVRRWRNGSMILRWVGRVRAPRRRAAVSSCARVPRDARPDRSAASARHHQR